MSTQNIDDLFLKWREERLPFSRIFVKLLIHVRLFPDDGIRIGLCWVGPGSNDFYCNATILARNLGLKGPNSLCANFRDHDVQKRKSTEGGSIPHYFPNRRQWKIRFHHALRYDCAESASEDIKRRWALQTVHPIDEMIMVNET
jgi:hypothetical protein